MSTEVQIYGPAFSSFVRTVMLCCEEKGIDYSLGFELDGEAIEFHSEAHYRIHPWGKLPVLSHQGRRLYETAAICRYLDANFGGPALQPADPYQRALVDQWSAAISGYVDQALVRRYLLEFAFPKGEDGSVRMERVAEAQPEVENTLAILTTQLADQPYICGDRLTIADLLLLPMLDYLAGLPHGETLIAADSPLAAYLARLRERPSAQKVLAKR
ncbi:glutathione S-transferase family protein [Marinobacterium arenosum]|uniref:glutathione S-transferase family protein n=1 Tax=Marinobacterium arenosum TaxID=2862496 RepID=UPI001C97AB95|nr:glutathione S-transferase family protein [Marinobacterium arenosum]MBY4675701.1 glutathione S-transferase family protein [Marinobacterium arenosum]